MTIRIAKRRQYACILTETLQDERLTFGARGLLAYLLSKPDDWHVNERHLAEQSPEGITAVRSMLKELQTWGYLKRERKQDAHGKWEWEQTIYESPAILLPDGPTLTVRADAESTYHKVPATAEPCLGFPRTDNPRADCPYTVEPRTGNRTLLNREIPINEVVINEVPNTVPAARRAPQADQATIPADAQPVPARQTPPTRPPQRTPQPKAVTDAGEPATPTGGSGSRLLAVYLDTWTARYGRAPKVDGAKVGASFKGLVEAHGYTEAECAAVIRFYFAVGDRWWEQNCHDTGILIGQWDRVYQTWKGRNGARKASGAPDTFGFGTQPVATGKSKLEILAEQSAAKRALLGAAYQNGGTNG